MIVIISLFFKISICIAQGVWTYYTDELPGVVFDMTQDKYGNYWFATDNAVCQLDTNGIWHTLVDSTVWDSTMFFKNQIVVDKENNKWFVGVAMSNPTKEYVVKYDDSTFTYYNPSGNEKDTWIQSLGVDSSGYIWAGSMANWAYWFDRLQWHPFYVPGTTIYDPILEFGVDRKGKLFIGHTNGLSDINSYLWGDLMWTAYSFSFDKYDRLWFGTNGRGLGIYDGNNVQVYTVSDGLLSNYVSVIIDSFYYIWASYGSTEKKFSRFDGRQWEHLTLEGVLGNDAQAFYVDKKGAIWFKNINGLSVYLDTTVSKVKYNVKKSQLNETIVLHQNFPNPFNSGTEIRFQLPVPGQTTLMVYNQLGQKIRTLVREVKQAGNYTLRWDGCDENGSFVASGVYVYILQSGEFVDVKKMVLLR